MERDGEKKNTKDDVCDLCPLIVLHAAKFVLF